MFLNLLTILFIGLKLTDYIDWSWWLVLLPAYVVWAFFGIVFLLAAVFGKGDITINGKKIRN